MGKHNTSSLQPFDFTLEILYKERNLPAPPIFRITRKKCQAKGAYIELGPARRIYVDQAEAHCIAIEFHRFIQATHWKGDVVTA